MKIWRCLAMLSLALGSAAAYADTPPPPASLSTYTIHLGADLSRTMIAATAFQKTRNVDLPRTGVFGPCTTQEMTWESNVDGIGPRVITCQERTTCFYKSTPSCDVTFVGIKDLQAAQLLEIKQVNPYTP